MVVAPSDHIISNEEAFREAILKAFDFTANNDSLLTLGIQPNRPDTGYGYIQFKETDGEERFKISKVKTFTEKPNLEMAKVFLFRAVTSSGTQESSYGITRPLPKHSKNTYLKCILTLKKASMFTTPRTKPTLSARLMLFARTFPLTMALWKKAKNVYVLSAEFGWSDLGYLALSFYEHIPHDKG